MSRPVFRRRDGSSTFDLSRFMGASLTMIDRRYGHLARDGREHEIHLVDTLETHNVRPAVRLCAVGGGSDAANASA